MIFFKPTVSADNKNIIEFEAIEDGNVSGRCTLTIDGDKAEIKSLSCDEMKPYICEGLIKSVFNYACLQNCYMGYINTDIPSFLPEKMGFKKVNGTYQNDIPSILQGNCCKTSDNI